MATRILTWNLQGRERPDLAEVAAVICGSSPDIVLLQEVQRRQARRIASHLGWARSWRFKHWPLVFPAEGLAVLAPRPPTAVQRIVLAHGAAFWSWKRRIALAATVSGPDGVITVVDTHLGAGVGDAERTRQALLVAGAGEVVAGDLNTAPGSAVTDALEAAGLRDAWAEARPGEPGPTNWAPGPRTGPPTQRLDYVFVSPAWSVVVAEVPSIGDPGFERYGSLSDHLPVTVVISRR